VKCEVLRHLCRIDAGDECASKDRRGDLNHWLGSDARLIVIRLAPRA
jgi:hypothetical protein